MSVFATGGDVSSSWWRNGMEMRNVWGHPNLYAPDKDEREPVIEEVKWRDQILKQYLSLCNYKAMVLSLSELI
jgi:hypothetical protein